MTCSHDLAKRETACADGMCPICLADQVEQLKSTVESWFTLASRTTEEVTPILMDGLRMYLRRSRSGGMPAKLADGVEAVLEDYCRLYVGAALVPVLRGISEQVDERGKVKLWEVLVPVADNDGVKYARAHHEEWDAGVNRITGGLTIEPVRKGKWRGNAEHMIPVRIACTREQLDRVIRMTLEHYDQEAVMARLVSDEVVIAHRSAV